MKIADQNLSVTASAPGKVNLYFAVGPVQEDGYHPVASLYTAVSLRERITVSSTDTSGISLTVSLTEDSPLFEMQKNGDFDLATVPLNAKNLAHQAAVAVLEEQGLTLDGVGFNIHIEKAVPVAGGMGGGSADAAAALVAVNEYLVRSGAVSEALSWEKLLELGADLGADVPFALTGGMAIGTGKGDVLEPIAIPDDIEPLSMVLVPASFGLSTPAVFRELDRGRVSGEYSTPKRLEVPDGLIEVLQNDRSAQRAENIAKYLHNDLAEPACALQPQLKEQLQTDLEDVVGSFVSGSGPTTIHLLVSEHSAYRSRFQEPIFKIVVATSSGASL